MKPPTTSTLDATTMTPSTLDLFILTFNCAKNLINTSVFAAHLYGALTQNATGLPDLVVFSLQEVAPLSYAFIGSYFLNPYYARFGEALNLASERVLAAAADDANDRDASSSSSAARPPYTLVRSKNVGMTSILLYARDPAAIRKIEEAECGFGAADIGNKGAVGLRVTWSDSASSGGTPRTTELTFVAAHLAAMEWNLKKRNSNWRSIVSGLTFANPRAVLPGLFPPADPSLPPTPDRSGAGDIAPPPPPPPRPTRLPTGDSPDPSEEEPESDGEEDEDGDTHPLLPTTTTTTTTPPPPYDREARAALHALSVYKPTAHLFVAGDLNYRIGSTTPPPLAAFPSLDPASEHYFPAFFARDQLTREREAGRTMHGLSEAEVRFAPTYKLDVLPPAASGDDGQAEAEAEAEAEVVPWQFAPHRWPSWCDRVLYLDVPAWAAAKAAAADGHGHGHGHGDDGPMLRVDVRAYDALPVVRTSDHRAVFFRARVPVLGEDEMRPPPEMVAEAEAEAEAERAAAAKLDPRLRLPVPVDVHAWERRAAARRKELVIGWSAYVWSTREGALLLATALAVGVGGWWLWRAW
ncbi:uncharacterized protein THITE_2112046 [Thermothielavioides terrestris NRRL 8126]|uniref:Inositol polyphosphate-related phosphatase domain-containing protein n=1 Tax=Thermothielavioides terrestris (strain ATCC 38088 / NRRL 8126) TaxID=578455 RepID=G2R4K2_THETT|nr:uncharacterized protein THITE_2112046 [Thermothielavioides terrestris NRRL 8126]AEO65237.1 hypothetical protein THITE_2112046 [Thermothielavioides terrestris NRRL 8126]